MRTKIANKKSKRFSKETNFTSKERFVANRVILQSDKTQKRRLETKPPFKNH
jgi:hypothetical protein